MLGRSIEQRKLSLKHDVRWGKNTALKNNVSLSSPRVNYSPQGPVPYFLLTTMIRYALPKCICGHTIHISRPAVRNTSHIESIQSRTDIHLVQ